MRTSLLKVLKLYYSRNPELNKLQRVAKTAIAEPYNGKVEVLSSKLLKEAEKKTT